MMKRLLTGILLLFCITCFSQTVKELEHELSFFKANEKWGQKIDVAYKLLSIDKQNANAINYIVGVYNMNKQKDSINIFFDRLIKENPKSPELYLLRAGDTNSAFSGLTDAQRIKYLDEACKIGSSNEVTISKIARIYYDIFIKEYRANKDKAKLDNCSSKAIKYFTILFNQNDSYKESIKYPLIQLLNYTGDYKKKKIYENYNVQTSYFPMSDLADLPNGWQTNYRVNVFRNVSESDNKVSGLQSAVFCNEWYSRHLKNYYEPVLCDSMTKNIIRFTWLRSFHGTVVIGLEKNVDSVRLYWKAPYGKGGDKFGKKPKVPDGKGGYIDVDIFINESKTLTNKEWQDITVSLDSIDFWKLPATDNSVMGFDGAQWILERKEPGKYHFVDRWSGGAIKNVCLKLLKLTDLEIKQSDIY
jgi:hypothetical protein